MLAEQKELYFHTKNHFKKELKKISPECISPLIAVRQIVKKAIEKYINDYCTKDAQVFSEEDFQEVSNRLYNEIINGEL